MACAIFYQLVSDNHVGIMCIPTGFNGFSYLIYVTDDQNKENTIFINFFSDLYVMSVKLFPLAKLEINKQKLPQLS